MAAIKYIIYDTSDGDEVVAFGEAPSGTAPDAPSPLAAAEISAADLSKITNEIAAGTHFREPTEPYTAWFEAYYEQGQPSEIAIVSFGGGVPPNPDLAAAAREKRNDLLAECDWTQLPDVDLTPGSVANFATYRQDLRDVPQQGGFPQTITWPTRPAEIKN